MKLNLRVIGTLGRTLIKQIDSLLVPTLFISNPAQRIQDGWISWCNRAGLLRELGGAIQIVELLRVNEGEIIEGHHRVWINRHNFFIAIPRLVIIFHCVVNKAGE